MATGGCAGHRLRRHGVDAVDPWRASSRLRRAHEFPRSRPTSSRLARTWPYTWTWIFFVGPFALAAVLFFVFRARAAGITSAPSLRAGALSLLATFLIQLVSQNLFVRYAYPVIWIGLIAFALLLLRGPRWLALMLVALSCLPIVNMWSAHSARLDLWPSLVTREAHYSAYTILPGVPNLGWLAIAGDGRHNTCIFVPQQDAQFPELIRRYFATVTVAPRFFDEHELDAFRRCPGPRPSPGGSFRYSRRSVSPIARRRNSRSTSARFRRCAASRRARARF